MGRFVRCCGVIGWLIAPPIAAAQLPPLGVPSGVVRLDLNSEFETFDRRFRAGTTEPYAADLISPSLGGDRIPALADADARIGRITGNASYRLTLGRLTADAQADVGRGVLGLSLGVTDRLTVFGRLPLVRSRVQSRIQLDPTGTDAGVAPLPSEQAPFFQQFDAALATLSAKLAAGDYDGNPSQKALAQSTLAAGTALRDDLFGLLGDDATASPIVPAAASAAGAAITGRIDALQNTLSSSLGVSGFSLEPTLPAQPLTAAEFQTYLRAADGLAFRINDAPLTFRGDAEAGASYTLVDRWDRGGRPGGLRAALSALARFPTGLRERSDRLLDLGTGSGHADLELSLVTDVGRGRWGARLTGTYLRQFAADITTRVTSPSQPLAGPDRLRTVRWDPGDVIAVGVRPFYRLAPTLAIQAGVDHWRRGEDAVTYANPADAIPNVDASVLADDSKANATMLALGITYANLAGLRPGGRGLPVDASWIYERVLTAGGGRVPNVHRVRASFRLYIQVF